MKTRFLLIGLSLLVSSGMAYAITPIQAQEQNALKETRLLQLGAGGADTAAQIRLEQQFYANQFRHIQDPHLPYFQFITRGGTLAMGIGVKVVGIAQYDWHGSFPGTDFAPYEIPIPADAANPSRFQGSIAHSSLFLSILGVNKVVGNYSVYVEGNFTGGDGRYFKLKQAYATVGDWTGGLTHSTFTDPASQPATIETEGPNSEISFKRLLLRYMHTFNKKWTVAISAEVPEFKIPTAAGVYEGTSAYMPDFAAFLQYGNNHRHLRVAGIVRGMRYRDLVEQKNYKVAGWGVMVSGAVTPVSPITIYAAAQTGRGIGNIVNDLSFGSNDLLGDASAPGKMYAPRSFGWYGALQINYWQNVYSTFIFSQERILPRNASDYALNGYKYGLYGTANLIWEITARVHAGIEVNVGKKMEMNGAHRMGYRANAMLSASF